MDDTVQYTAVIKLEKVTTKEPERASSSRMVETRAQKVRVVESTNVTVRSGSLDGLKRKLDTIMTTLDDDDLAENNR
jgi:hypothetical protein